ncbi:hypothetical protein [Leifsonia aquatica]|uniref:hypothetical protein n=1 Tax=Leifsonia aquatica TaxID=144185 RepID=UPI00046A1E24|nr:hypothetical protein [Leifsonia aquatica]
MTTKLTSNRPLPGYTARNNPAWVAEYALLVAYAAFFVVVLVLDLFFNFRLNLSVVFLVAYLVMVAVALLRPQSNRYVLTPQPTKRPERVLTKEEVAAIGGPLLDKLSTQRPGDVHDVDLVADRSFAEPTSYPIPPSIARALGAQATAQIEKDTEARR